MSVPNSDQAVLIPTKKTVSFNVLTTENHKNKTRCVDTFHIRIPLHILTQGIFEQQEKSYMPILTFSVKTEPKIFKETLLLLMKFMSSF